jgi:hypothetical protein
MTQKRSIQGRTSISCDQALERTAPDAGAGADDQGASAIKALR